MPANTAGNRPIPKEATLVARTITQVITITTSQNMGPALLAGIGFVAFIVAITSRIDSILESRSYRTAF
jgi:hypothetical protein